MAVFLPTLPIILTEQGGRRRRILLSGVDLPHDQSATMFGGGLRSAIRYYPGASEPSVQILGPDEAPIRFSGEFDDRRRGIPGWAVSQVYLIDQVRRDGFPVVFEYGPFRRTCAWRRFEFQTRELQRIPYTIELEVVEHGFGKASERSRVFSALKKIPGLESVVTAVRGVSTVLDVLPSGIGGERLSRARAAVGKATSAVGLAQGVLDTLRTVGQVINPAIASTAATHLSGAKSALKETYDHVTDLDWRQAAGSAFDALVGAGKSAASVVVDVVKASGQIDRVLPSIESLVDRSTEDAVYVASEGETLQRIAQRFYGDAGAWTRIAEANGKENGAVSGGEVLLIPDAPRPRSQAAAP